MSPQKFVKTLPVNYTEQKASEGFKCLISLRNGFLATSVIGNYRGNRWVYTENIEGFGAQDKIALRLPDGRLVIPTIKGESET